MSDLDSLPRTRAVLEAGMARREHLGGQLYASLRGITVADAAFGEARRGLPMQRETSMSWFSSGKPLTAIAIAQLFERGRLDLHAPVGDLIPGFGQRGKEAITIWHLLTHTAGLRLADKLSPTLSWDETIRRIVETPLEPDWPVGQQAGYSTRAAWFILGEIVQRLSARPFPEYLRSEILTPAAMPGTTLHLTAEEFAQAGDRLGWLYNTSGPEPVPLPMQDAAGLALVRPGSSARGPIRELGRFYETLLGLHGPGLITRKTLDLFRERHRQGLYDHTFLHTLDFGLGFILNSNRYGPETWPYSYGRHASEDAFGHSGVESSCAFADPPHALVVAWVLNGLPGERPHHRRARDLNTALYEDLSL